MRRVVKIWVLVAVMVMGGALPPQVMGDNALATQWCVQAKSKKKDKKKKKKDKQKDKQGKKDKKKDKRKSKKSQKSFKQSTASTLMSVPAIGKTSSTAAAAPQQNTNTLLNALVHYSGSVLRMTMKMASSVSSVTRPKATRNPIKLSF